MRYKNVNNKHSPFVFEVDMNYIISYRYLIILYPRTFLTMLVFTLYPKHNYKEAPLQCKFKKLKLEKLIVRKICQFSSNNI